MFRHTSAAPAGLDDASKIHTAPTLALSFLTVDAGFPVAQTLLGRKEAAAPKEKGHEDSSETTAGAWRSGYKLRR